MTTRALREAGTPAAEAALPPGGLSEDEWEELLDLIDE
jgi:hypothetical protein